MLSILKTKVMTSDPNTLWQVDGQSMFEFLFKGSRITADGDRSHDIQRRLLLGRKVMTNLDSTLKSRDITLPTRTVVLEKSLESPLYCKEIWQASILKDMSPEYSLEELMLKLKLQNFGHLMQRAASFEKTLMLGEIEVQRRKACQRMRWLDGIIDSVDMNCVNFGSWWLTGRFGVLQSMGLQRFGHNWVTELRRLPFNFLECVLVLLED